MSHKRKPNTNRFGLSRYIPPEIKQDVRKRSGFGCVICGFAICQYEHVDPEFVDAKEHDPDCMTLLCGRCNDKKKRGILSKDYVKRAMMNPKCYQEGFTFDSFDVGASLPTFEFCGSVWNAENKFIPLRINQVDLIKFEPPEKEGAPYLLSATFFNEYGVRIFWIDNNEWYGDINNWDIETVGRTIKIKYQPLDLCLQITNIPNDRLIIERINMLYKRYKIVGDGKTGFTVTTPNNKRSQIKNATGSLSGSVLIAFEIEGDRIAIGKAMAVGRGIASVSVHIDSISNSG